MGDTYDPAQHAFKSAIHEFKSNLKNEELYRQILETTSIDQVYDATDSLQKEQAKKGHLRNLSKIDVYLSRLREYAGVVEVFVQVQPDILALIWGPIKLILQWANVLKQSFDAIVNTLEEIGILLPEFTEMSRIFEDNDRVKEVLVLFFKDILDFYLITLQFFSSSRLKFVFEMLWPSRREKIKMVGDLIKRHTLLMRNKVRLEEIREAHNSRRRDLEHLQLTERVFTQQEYNSVRVHVSPRSYDEDLYRLSESICPRTGRWLFQDKFFQEWINSTASVFKILWLKGIPGSGKTFLAATIINHAKALKSKVLGHNATLFVFLSYKESHTTALSVIHSLIFQLTDDSGTLQTALCQSSRQNMRSSLEVAVGLLESLLRCAGFTFIVVDGIDEIEEVERVALLKRLLQILKSCEGCRILLSSRPESDITAILKDHTVDIEVNKRNSGSVQAYVNNRMAEWFQVKAFDPEFQRGIEGSLAKLAHTANGMFLYARVIFAIIWEIDTLEELRSLLRSPPATLNDAYGRIFDRINQSTNVLLKSKARRILGWVCCAPSPLTRREIEHALIVNSGDIEGEARVVSVLDVVRVCGPMVEVVDDYVQFVHFTAKEYILHNKTLDHITLLDATLSLTTCCITYLCQAHHNEELSREDIGENLLSGAYRLHDFAALFWFELLKQFLILNKTDKLPDDLVDGLESLYDERYDAGHQANAESQDIKAEFDIFGPKLAPLQQMLNNVSGFQMTVANSDYHLGQETRWIHLDPLTNSRISTGIYAQLDRLLCPTAYHERGCACSTIRQNYGPRVFKCGFLRCQSRRHGFKTRSERNSHERHHEQPWKCDVPGCEYSDTGFLTRKWRDYHLQSDHRPEKKATVGVLGDPDEDEIQPLLFDLVGTDNVEAVRALLPRFESLPNSVKDELYVQAAISGSSSMLDLIWPTLWERGKGINDDLSRIATFIAAIRAGNFNSSTWLVAKLRAHASSLHQWSRIYYCGRILAAVVTSESKEMYDNWKAAILSCAIDGIDNREAMRYVSDFTGSLVNVASTTCSVDLARTLLDAGAEVDFRRSSKYLTPLHCAARKSTEEAARLMEFLLHRGADPNTSSKHRKLEDEEGIRQISRWLGYSWDELVEKTMANRKATEN
ncbi:Nacht domain protein [Colletotrichum higginsianum IMI 349063]|uniref:Nacht domain protein n=1 Tax=Colletotrichum higginsianum (strain IMI 349063) TaxID=759273 RepID=A0A1B7XTG7_COLHI|nr:Nacht domain protein [Colletotrichum higginsianum IMI 349063]OBR03043.1 Nacht domain protein [Colletotrichum higginsianum IMI 349063]